MVEPPRSVNCTEPPALITVGACAVRISVPRLRCSVEMAITEISKAAARPITTILRWVVRSAVYIDQFMAASKVIAIRRSGLEKGSRCLGLNVGTGGGFQRPHHIRLKRRECFVLAGNWLDLASSGQ